jgi:transposase
MGRPRKYPDELRERAVRLVLEMKGNEHMAHGAAARVGRQLGVNVDTLRTWVTEAEVEQGRRPGTTKEDAARIRELEREVRELRRANEILKSATAFFAAELDRPHHR